MRLEVYKVSKPPASMLLEVCMYRFLELPVVECPGSLEVYIPSRLVRMIVRGSL